jgi:hypothetical protein
MMVFTCAITHSFSLAWTPVNDVPNYASFDDRYARLHLTAIADTDSPNSFTINYEVSYYVQPGLNNSTRFTMITTGTEPNAGIGISLDSSHYLGLSYFLLENGTWLEYDTWQYSGTMKLYISYRQTELFPYDIYQTQWLYIWFNSTVYPRITLESVPSPGFELSIDERGLVNRNSTWEEMSLGQRLFVGVPEVSPLSIRLETFRSPTDRFYFATFSFSIDLMVFWVPTLTVLSVKSLADRIKILSGIAISVLAFMWTLTPLVQSITYTQLFAILVILIWSGAEVFRQGMKPSKKIGYSV